MSAACWSVGLSVWLVGWSFGRSDCLLWILCSYPSTCYTYEEDEYICTGMAIVYALKNLWWLSSFQPRFNKVACILYLRSLFCALLSCLILPLLYAYMVCYVFDPNYVCVNFPRASEPSSSLSRRSSVSQRNNNITYIYSDSECEKIEHKCN